MSYTKSQIKKAGNNLVNDVEIEESLDILSFWRAKHSVPLETAFDLLKVYIKKVSNTSDKDFKPLIAKRLKRTESIINKLKRFGDMQLHRINDIGGCRAVLSSKKKAYRLTKALIKDGHFKLRRDYIDIPKESGYRSIHLIGYFPDEDGQRKPIELQIRTRIQHSWATALEIVDLYTAQSIKTNAGSKEWTDFFIHISAMFELLEENPYVRSSNLPAVALEFGKNFVEKEDERLEYSLYKVYRLSEKLRTIERFDAFSSSVKITSEHIKQVSIDGYILISIQKQTDNVYEVQSRIFRRIEFDEASAAYLALEKEAIGKNSNLIVALVSTTALGGIQEAYPNYFADAKVFMEFLGLLNYVYKKLTPPHARLIDRFRFWVQETAEKLEKKRE